MLDGEWLRFTGLSPTKGRLAPRDESILSLASVCDLAENGPTYAEDPSRVAARVEIGLGTLEARAKTRDAWGFQPSRETEPYFAPRQLAQEIVLRYRFKGGFSLTSETHGAVGWSAKTPIEFKNIDGDLEIVVGNAPVEDIFAVAELSRHRFTDPHFELFYKLMESHNGVPHIGVVSPETRVSSPISMHGSNCPPATWP
jgi:hypothetical protein